MATTPLMNLNLPTPTVTTGPEWAEQVNQAFEVVDSHDHSSGKGTKVTPSGIDINSDFNISQNNVINTRSYRMFNNSAALSDPSDLREIYTANGELFYNDGVGNQVQITASGGLNAASIGGIGGDYASSSALLSYNNTTKTFLFEQNTGINALIDCSDVTLREAAASANGITLRSPLSLSASYDLILPIGLPVTDTVVTLNSSGQLATSFVTTSLLADGSVTKVKQGAAGQQISISSGTFSTSSGSYVTVTNLSVSITTTGRPVYIALQPEESPNPANPAQITRSGGSAATARFRRDSTSLGEIDLTLLSSNLPGSISYLDTPTAGTYTYDFQVTGDGTNTVDVFSTVLVVYEI